MCICDETARAQRDRGPAVLDEHLQVSVLALTPVLAANSRAVIPLFAHWSTRPSQVLLDVLVMLPVYGTTTPASRRGSLNGFRSSFFGTMRARNGWAGAKTPW